MKELSIEEKAKAYDKVREKIALRFGSNVADEIFSQFEMSEDERIRKAIIEYFENCNIKHSDWITWLEKQGKQTSWKPSKEEMDVLYGLAYITNQYDEHKEEVITRLYQDLKREFFNGSSYENMFPNTEDDVRRRSTIQVLEYARSLDTYNQYGKADIDKNIAWLEKQGEPQGKGEISDGYHTFNELYYYRMLYNAAFFNMLPKEWVHKSKKHHDGEDCFGGGWFIVMANLPTGQISNHYELKDWDLFQIPEKEVADKWDGHTPQEAADRLHKYLLEKQDKQPSAIRWYDVSLIPQEMEELLVEWDSEDATWHEIAFYHADTKTFWNGTRQVENVTRWCYITDWLEKQGEQKVSVVDFKAKDWYVSKVDGKIRNIYYSVDKVEPKFKVGDWVVYNYPNTVNPISEIIQIDRDIIDLKDTNGSYFQTTISELNCNYHLWNISDAKEGDVLSFNDGHGNDSIELIKSITDKKIEFWFYLTNGNRYEVFDGITPYTNLVSRENATPATKEQRDTLIKAMTDAGYTFDFEKKELKKIEQNPTWDEDDEYYMSECIGAIATKDGWSFEEKRKTKHWLKSLKQRYTWKPNDKQMNALDSTLQYSQVSYNSSEHLNSLFNDLKKLREEEL